MRRVTISWELSLHLSLSTQHNNGGDSARRQPCEWSGGFNIFGPRVLRQPSHLFSGLRNEACQLPQLPTSSSIHSSHIDDGLFSFPRSPFLFKKSSLKEQYQSKAMQNVIHFCCLVLSGNKSLAATNTDSSSCISTEGNST